MSKTKEANCTVFGFIDAKSGIAENLLHKVKEYVKKKAKPFLRLSDISAAFNTACQVNRSPGIIGTNKIE